MTSNVVPLYRGLRSTLVEEIASGRFPVGSRFPTDNELCERFQVSRHTIRAALHSLQQEGLLVRQPGSGTIVAAKPGATRYVHAIESVEQVYDTARASRLTINHVGWVRLGDDLAKTLERPVGERWLQVSGLRSIAGENVPPHAWVDVFVAQTYGAVREDITGELPIYRAIERRFRQEVHAMEMRLSAVALSPGHAHLLGAEPGSPGLQSLRRYLTQRDEPMELALTIEPGTKPSHTMRFSRASNQSPDGGAPGTAPPAPRGDSQ